LYFLSSKHFLPTLERIAYLVSVWRILVKNGNSGKWLGATVMSLHGWRANAGKSPATLGANFHQPKEIEMKTNLLLNLFVAFALLAVIALTVREAVATHAVALEVDSATRSYSGWAREVEAGNSQAALVPVTSNSNVINSATQSYTGWAKAVKCGADLADDKTIDSATRSYIAWAKALEVGEICK
jgi:hypothetical protein